jgi:hypothetical protein
MHGFVPVSTVTKSRDVFGVIHLYTLHFFFFFFFFSFYKSTIELRTHTWSHRFNAGFAYLL